MEKISLIQFFSIYFNLKYDIKRKRTFKFVEHTDRSFVFNKTKEILKRKFNDLWLDYVNSNFTIIDFQLALCMAEFDRTKFLDIDSKYINKSAESFSKNNCELAKKTLYKIKEITKFTSEDIYKVTDKGNIFFDMINDKVCDLSIFSELELKLETKEKPQVKKYNITKIVKILIERKNNG